MFRPAWPLPHGRALDKTRVLTVFYTALHRHSPKGCRKWCFLIGEGYFLYHGDYEFASGLARQIAQDRGVKWVVLIP